MTESQWLAATDPRRMLHSPGWRPSPRHRQPEDTGACHPRVNDERKLRLYACECFRLSFPVLVYALDRRAVDTAERFADGLVDEADLLASSRNCGATAVVTTYRPALSAARNIIGGRAIRPDHPAGPQQFLPNSVRAELLRCFFGNPFRPVAFADSWRTETAVSLAAGIYAERAFDRLPILADALEEAGCDHPDILAHCRQPGPHARGCWVVDGVLGRA